MTKIFENELYKFAEMPKIYNPDLCHKCGFDDFEETMNEASTARDPFFIRTCFKCDSQWEVNFTRKYIYFYGEDEKEVEFNQ